jgi:hypothetical protein
MLDLSSKPDELISILIPGRQKTAPKIPAAAALWLGTSHNTKTGDVPTLWIGRTRSESLKSCKGCPMLEAHDCYAQHSRVAISHGEMVKALDHGKDYSLKTALGKSRKTAKIARFGAIGDPGALPRKYLIKAIAAVKKFDLRVVGYSRLWLFESHQYLRSWFMASCYSLEEVDKAISKGFRATVVLPYNYEKNAFRTPDGHKGIVCPAIARENITCNDCALCDASKKGPVIGFPNHGPHKPKSYKRPKIGQVIRGWIEKLKI